MNALSKAKQQLKQIREGKTVAITEEEEINIDKLIEKQQAKKSEHIWYVICYLISGWEKETKRDFIKDYKNMKRGD